MKTVLLSVVLLLSVSLVSANEAAMKNNITKSPGKPSDKNKVIGIKNTTGITTIKPNILKNITANLPLPSGGKDNHKYLNIQILRVKKEQPASPS